MKIYLVRHGAAEHPAVDPRRPLSADGRREVEDVAAALCERGVRPARFAHSPKARAVETAALLAAALAPEAPTQERADLLPLSPVDALAIELSVGAEAGDAMLVAHMPLLGDLACALLGSKAGDYPQFPTAGVMCIEQTAAGEWEQRWMIGP